MFSTGESRIRTKLLLAINVRNPGAETRQTARDRARRFTPLRKAASDLAMSSISRTEKNSTKGRREDNYNGSLRQLGAPANLTVTPSRDTTSEFP